MAEKISWHAGLTIKGGPQLSVSGVVESDAYDRVVVKVPGDGVAVEADVQPADAVNLLTIQSSVYDDADLTYGVTGGASGVVLDGPQLLVGSGMVSLLGAVPKTLSFTNNLGAGNDATVTILVGRRAT